MAPITKRAALFARWALGRSDTGLPPWNIDAIQRGTLGYRYKDIPMLKNPFDLSLYSLLIGRERPRTIIEIGTYKGGATTWLADQLAIHGIDGMVHSLDIIDVDLPASPRITLHRGSALEIDKVFPADWIDAVPRPLLLIDDGNHNYFNIKAVLEHFGPRMRKGEYIVVEDGSAGDLGLWRELDGGPLRAIREFLAGGAPFEIDRSYCDFYGRNMTWNVDGFLRRL
jgi:cephalosporin hydroxylase